MKPVVVTLALSFAFMANPTVAEFWQQQTFAFIETYSFNRGPKSVEEYKRLSQKITAAKEALASGRPILRSKVSGQVCEWEEEIIGNKYNVTLPEPEKALDSTTQRIAIISPESETFEKLDTLLRQSDKQEAFSGCVPIFRDALVFYN